jgi:hypothetical protein
VPVSGKVLLLDLGDLDRVGSRRVRWCDVGSRGPMGAAGSRKGVFDRSLGLSRDERGEQQGGCDLPKPWNKRVTVQHV